MEAFNFITLLAIRLVICFIYLICLIALSAFSFVCQLFSF